jgi:hypothetical protein
LATTQHGPREVNVPVRIFFRGLILFRFPTSGADAGKIVAELISDRTVGGQTPPHRHHHQAEIRILSSAGHIGPKPIVLDSRIDITAPPGAPNHPIVRSQSWIDHVPRLRDIVGRSKYSGITAGTNPTGNRFLHSTVVINGGLLRVRNVVIWDASGFPLVTAPNGALPATAAQLKFMESGVLGHMANECVVEIAEADSVSINGYRDVDPKTEQALTGRPPVPGQKVNANFRPSGSGNPITAPDTVEILINNYEHQRVKPTPWGLDFQWLFLRAGYPLVDLSGGEFNALDTFGNNGYEPGVPPAQTLWKQDRNDLLPNQAEGLPFPYVIRDKLTPLTALPARLPPAEIDARPVCVPGEE